MNRTVLKYGGYASLVLVIAFVGSYLLMGNEAENYTISEIIGYLSILVATLFAFLGIKEYRDKEQQGTLSFWKGLQIGTLIVILPALIFGLYNLIYVEYLDPDFMENYYQHQITQIKADFPEDVATAKIEEMESQKEAFQSPMVQFFAMFMTVFIIGFIVSFISALILKNSPKPSTS